MSRALARLLPAAVAAVAIFLGSSPRVLADGPAPAGAGTPPPTVPAEELAGRVTTLEEQVKAHVDEKSSDSMRQDLSEISKLLPVVTDAKLRARLVVLPGKILGVTKDVAIVKFAIKTIGDTGDSSTFKSIKSYLQQPNPKEVPPFLIDALEATGKIKADDGVPIMIGIVENSKRFEASTAAMKALGKFGASKRMRNRIVTDLVSTVRKDVPGVGYDPDKGDPSQRQKKVRTGDEAASRWDALSAALVPCLNELTGQNAASAQDWFSLFDQYKRNLDSLFVTK